MKKSKFSEEKIISIIREGDPGAKVADLCRKHGMSDCYVLQMESQVCRHGCVAAAAVEGSGDREQPPKADVCGFVADASGVAGCC